MKINYWKVGVFAAIVLALMYWAHSCGVRSVIVKAGKIDTVYAKPQIVIAHDTVLKPYKVIKRVVSHVFIDTSGIAHEVPHDSTNDDPHDDFVYLYEHTERLKYSTVTINDTIKRSQILGRSVMAVYDSIPVITKTVLLTQPKKTILYFGCSVYGNRNLNFGAGVDLSLKGRNDKQYGVGILYTNQLYYGLTYKIPIRLKKK